MSLHYEPIEFFLMGAKDDGLVSWISDQSGCLRSVYTLFESVEPKIKKIITVGNVDIKIVRESEDTFKVSCNEAIASLTYDSATWFHLKDGTSVMFMLSNNSLQGYYFCFEDMPEETVQQMLINENVPQEMSV